MVAVINHYFVHVEVNLFRSHSAPEKHMKTSWVLCMPKSKMFNIFTW